MIINAYTSKNIDDFFCVVDEFNNYIEKKQIQPTFFSDLCFDDIDDDLTLLIAKDDKEGFLGVASFIEIMPRDYPELFCFMDNEFGYIINEKEENIDEFGISSSIGFRDYSFSRPMVYLSCIESFKRGTRAGINMIDHIKELPDIESIFLYSVEEKDIYYFEHEFTYTGLYSGHVSEPIMYWDKSGVY